MNGEFLPNPSTPVTKKFILLSSAIDFFVA